MMDEKEKRCCSCCCFDFSDNVKKETIEMYQPVVPKGRSFTFPQIVEPRPSDQVIQPASKSTVISEQPMRQAHSLQKSTPAFTTVAQTVSPAPPAMQEHSISVIPTESDISPDPNPKVSSHKDASLQFNVYYDKHRETLNVHIHQGYYFPQKSSSGVDSFITAFLLPTKHQVLRTKMVSNSRFPAFDELLEFSGLSLQSLKQQTLVLQVFYHENIGSDVYLSSCFTKLSDVDLYGTELNKRIDEGMELLEVC